MDQYRCGHNIRIEELVSSDVHRVFGDKSWMFLNPQMLRTLDALRKRYGVMYLNDWLWGGPNQYKVFREASCIVGAPLSQHRLGNAADPKFKHVTAEEVRADAVKRDNQGWACLITQIESDVSWFHFSCGNIDTRNGIKIIKG